MFTVITMWQQYHSFTSAGRGQFYDYDSFVLQYNTRYCINGHSKLLKKLTKDLILNFCQYLVT